MNILQKITLPFTIIGAFNWGLVALFNFNLVEWITRGFNCGLCFGQYLNFLCGFKIRR